MAIRSSRRGLVLTVSLLVLATVTTATEAPAVAAAGRARPAHHHAVPQPGGAVSLL